MCGKRELGGKIIWGKQSISEVAASVVDKPWLGGLHPTVERLGSVIISWFLSCWYAPWEVTGDGSSS